MLGDGEAGDVGGGLVGGAEDAAAGREAAHEGVEACVALGVRLSPMRKGEKRQPRLAGQGGKGAAALPRPDAAPAPADEGEGFGTPRHELAEGEAGDFGVVHRDARHALPAQ
ncbi:MAG: hypothetical protein IJK04_14295, partial [Kiritimatiellae bacterium]|nr:hypothetical protein [Kiritimatiellia bacterium]